MHNSTYDVIAHSTSNTRQNILLSELIMLSYLKFVLKNLIKSYQDQW